MPGFWKAHGSGAPNKNVREHDRDRPRSPESLQKQIRQQIAIGIVNRQYPLDRPLPSSPSWRRTEGQHDNRDAGVPRAGGGRFRQRADALRVFREPGRAGDPGHTPKPHAPTAVEAPARVDYGKLFRGRSFNRERVVKPPDCLVRYRYPFVCGLIDPSLFPVARWRECVHDAVSAVAIGNCATDFSDTDDRMLVEQLTQRVLAKRGIVAHPDEVLVTLGGQQALYLAMRLLLAPVRRSP